MNGIRKMMCSIACCFMILGNAPINIYAAEEDPTIEATITETLANEPEQNPEVLSTQPSQDPSIQDPSTDPDLEEEPEEEIKEGETTETPNADLGVATALMMAGASTYRGQSGNGQNGNHDGNSGGGTGAHIDVRFCCIFNN